MTPALLPLRTRAARFWTAALILALLGGMGFLVTTPLLHRQVVVGITNAGTAPLSTIIIEAGGVRRTIENLPAGERVTVPLRPVADSSVVIESGGVRKDLDVYVTPNMSAQVEATITGPQIRRL
jgi:hypothetical protein